MSADGERLPPVEPGRARRRGRLSPLRFTEKEGEPPLLDLVQALRGVCEAQEAFTLEGSPHRADAIMCLAVAGRLLAVALQERVAWS